MCVMDANKNTQFILDPKELKLNNHYLLNKEVVSLLIKKNVQLIIDVYDSDPQNSNKPIILFIHGNSTSKNVFATQIKYYQNHYRILAVDLLGHGKSTKVSELNQLNAAEQTLLSESIYNLCVMTAAIQAVLIAKACRAVHIFGWSLGGHVAYGLAMENPERIASITTIGSPPILFSSLGLKKGLSAWFVETLIPEWINHPQFYTSQDAEKIMMRMGFNRDDTIVADELKSTDPAMRKCLFQTINHYQQNYAKILNAENFVKTTNIPLCLIYGERDSGINSAYIKELREFANPRSQVAIIKDAPHAVFRSFSDELHQITDRFIAESVLSSQ